MDPRPPETVLEKVLNLNRSSRHDGSPTWDGHLEIYEVVIKMLASIVYLSIKEAAGSEFKESGAKKNNFTDAKYNFTTPTGIKISADSYVTFEGFKKWVESDTYKMWQNSQRWFIDEIELFKSDIWKNLDKKVMYERLEWRLKQGKDKITSELVESDKKKSEDAQSSQ